jgi:hypothetical protein
MIRERRSSDDADAVARLPVGSVVNWLGAPTGYSRDETCAVLNVAAALSAIGQDDGSACLSATGGADLAARRAAWVGRCELL